MPRKTNQAASANTQAAEAAEAAQAAEAAEAAQAAEAAEAVHIAEDAWCAPGAGQQGLRKGSSKRGGKKPAHLKRSRFKRAFSYILIVAAAVGVAFFVRAFVAEPFEIPSESMMETLQVGDRLIGEKVTYLVQDPQRGDIATFVDPENPSTILIKRVIGVPGDTIDIPDDGYLYINGEKQDEPYTGNRSTNPLAVPSRVLEEPITYPYTLKEGEYWMMGDNRTNSLDSRYFGPIKRDAFTSKAWFIFFPFSQIKLL